LSTPSKVDLFQGASPGMQDRVRVEQMKMLFEGSVAAAIGATFFAFALAWHLHGAVPSDLLRLWVAAKVVAVAPRVVHGLMFNRRTNDSLGWLTWGRVLLLVDGLVWGSVGAV
jgi:hypothetical protein